MKSRLLFKAFGATFTALVTCVGLLYPTGSTAAPTTKPSATTKPATGGRGNARNRPPSPGALMDYGPFLSSSLIRPRSAPPATKPATRPATKPSTGPADEDGTNFIEPPKAISGVPVPPKTDGGDLIATKGISMRVGNGSYVCFDTDAMSLSAGWTGAFIDFARTNLAETQGSNPPRVAATRLAFATNTEPGWASRGSFADTRPPDGGPLPTDWAHYRGLYRNGEKVVLSYTVGKAEVLELDGSVADAGDVGFTRTIHMGPSPDPQQINVCEWVGALGTIVPRGGRTATAHDTSGPADASTAVITHDNLETIVGVVGAPKGATLAITENARISLSLPAAAAPATFKVVIASLSPTARPKFASLLKLAASIEDPQALCHGGPALWPKPIVTKGNRAADDAAYVVDTVATPDENPWKSWMRTSGFDFFSDGRAAVCTWNGDVWIVSSLDASLGNVSWRRVAAGLYEPLGLKIVDDVIYVLGRDQITRLHDLNGDGEMDFYENFCSAWPASPIYHAFNLDLQTDSSGNFYFSTCGNQALPWMRMKGDILMVPKEGGTCEVFCTGLRAANGLGMGPHDELTVSDNQGHWTPVDRINVVKFNGFYGYVGDPRRLKKGEQYPVHETYDLPLCWIRYPNPDNSAGAQVWAGNNWGPLSGDMLCTSYGKSSLLEVFQEQVDGVAQGGVVKLPLKFDSGIMRARVNAKDGQLWVCGMKGWQTNAVRAGSLQRVRYTGKPANLPTALHILPDGISISFSDPLDPELAADADSYSIEEWNYQWTKNYGSDDYKASNPKAKGHDTVAVQSAKLSADHKTVTLETGPLKPVMQMAIEMNLKSADGAKIKWEIDNTINKENK